MVHTVALVHATQLPGHLVLQHGTCGRGRWSEWCPLLALRRMQARQRRGGGGAGANQGPGLVLVVEQCSLPAQTVLVVHQAQLLSGPAQPDLHCGTWRQARHTL